MVRCIQESADAAAFQVVMAGLDPAIHVFVAAIAVMTWMPGTSPGMTT